jgi:hypothetical protein
MNSKQMWGTSTAYFLTGEYEGREVSGSERYYRGWEGKEFNIGFEGSPALPICPFGKCKYLTGTIEV